MSTPERKPGLAYLESLVEQLRTSDRAAARERLLELLRDDDEQPLTPDEARRLFVVRTSGRLELGPSLVSLGTLPPDDTAAPPLVHACQAWEAARAGDVAAMESALDEAFAGMTFGEETGAARVTEWCCQALFDAGRYELLLDLARRSVRGTRGSSSSRARLLLFFGTALSRRAQPEEAQSVLEQALEMAEEVGDARARMLVLKQLGQCSYLKSDSRTAMQHHQRAVELERGLDIPEERLSLIHGLGSLAYQRRDLTTALEQFQIARSLAEDLGDVGRKRQLSSRLGCVHRDLQELEEGRRLLTEALESYPPDEASSRALTHHDLGLLEHLRWYPHAALSHYDSAIELARKGGAPLIELVASLARGMLRIEQHRYEAAARCFEDAAVLGHEAGHAGYEATALAGQAVVAALDGEFEKAQEFFAEAEATQPVTGSSTDGQLIELLRAFLPLGRARLADAEDRQRHLHRAQQYLAASAGAARELGSIVDRGTDYLIALRAVEAHIELARVSSPTATAANEKPPALRIGPGGDWLERNGTRVDLRRRGPLRRLLMTLVEHHGADGDEPLSVYELADVVWADEELHPETAANRVYSAVWSLRQLGLEDSILTTTDGYRLDPRLVVEVTAHTPE